MTPARLEKWRKFAETLVVPTIEDAVPSFLSNWGETELPRHYRSLKEIDWTNYKRQMDQQKEVTQKHGETSELYYEVIALYGLGDAVWRRLITLVRNSESAAKYLSKLATAQCQALQDIAETHPEYLRQFPSESRRWPVLAGRDLAARQCLYGRKGGKLKPRSAGLLERLNQSETCSFDLGINRTGKPGRPRARDFDSPVKKLTVQLVDFIEKYRVLGIMKRPWPEWVRSAVALPDYNKNSAAAWFRVAWKILMRETDGHPESHPDLRKLGLHRAERAVTVNAEKKFMSGTREANIRNGIKIVLRQAFRTCAAFPRI
jgi:hypothetical protein